MAGRLQQALHKGSYTSAVGRELQRISVAAMDQAGWLTYDAGFSQRARRWWLETCHLADLADIPEESVMARASLAKLAGEQPDGGPEAVELARLAAADAKGAATSSLVSLLAAREAIGHAQAGDASAATAAVARARQALDRGRGPDEPFWLAFYGPADLASHEAQVGILNRNGAQAEAGARAALDGVDAERYPRNHVLYTVRLGSVLTQRGRLDEAISVTRSAVAQVGQVRGSGRIVADLRRTVDRLGRQHYPPAKTFATAARRLLPAPA
jgi:hypothetical protein